MRQSLPPQTTETAISSPVPSPNVAAPAPRIWAVGGGKGGVGKSVITANMAVVLAREGKRCVILDADLGGANIHTLVGLPNPKKTLSDLFSRRGMKLEAVMVPTPIPNLQLISGSRALMEMANPKHVQKEKIIRQLFSLDVDHIFIDLGAGSAFNALDFFLAAHTQVMVVVPTPTSVENAYHFLKAVYYRKLKKAIQTLGAQRLVDRAMGEKMLRGIRSPRDLIASISRENPSLGASLAAEMSPLAPALIVNQIRTEEEMDLGPQMKIACRDFFGLDVEFLGCIRNDDRAYNAVRMKRPAMEAYPQSSFSLALREITRKLAAAPFGGR
jgi:flagellar biosynthesis protein FlhG